MDVLSSRILLRPSDMNRSRRFGPKPIALKRCRFVTVRGITIVHSPNYCVSLGGCDDVAVPAEFIVIRVTQRLGDDEAT